MTSNRVRASVEAAFGESGFEHVTVDDGAIEETAEEFAADELPVPDWTGGAFPGEDHPDEAILDLFVLVAANNFQFLISGENYRATYGGETWEGALAMWASFADALERGEPITDADHLRALTPADVRALFAGEADDDTTIPMMDERHELLTGMGEALGAAGADHVHELVESSGTVRLFDDGEGFVERLIELFPAAFDDARELDGRTVAFDKKAQLAAATLYGRFLDEPFFDVEDVNGLTLFADYVVPANLRAAGILEYDDHLAGLVEEGAELEVGSREEVEIRAAAVLAGDRLRAAVDDRRDDDVSMPQVDYRLWVLGRDLDVPFHVVRTTTY